MATSDQFLKHLVVDRGTIADAEKQSQWAAKKQVWVPHPDLGYVCGGIKVPVLLSPLCLSFPIYSAFSLIV